MCAGVCIYNVRPLPLCSRYRLDFIFLRRRCLLPPLLRASSRHFISPASAPRFLWGHPRVKIPPHVNHRTYLAASGRDRPGVVWRSLLSFVLCARLRYR